MTSLRVTFPKQMGVLTLSFDPNNTVAETKMRVVDAGRQRGFPLLTTDNYMLHLAATNQPVTNEASFRLVDLGAKVGSVLDVELRELDPMTSVWKEKVVPKTGAVDPSTPVTVKIQFAGGSQTMAVPGSETLADLKSKLHEKISKIGGSKAMPDMASFCIQVTDSGLLLANEGITILDVCALESISPTKTLVLTLKPKGDMKFADSSLLQSNYRTGMLNYMKGAKPQIKSAKVRWFVLNEFTLFYYHGPQDQAPKQTMIVHADSEVDQDDQNSNPKMFYFVVKLQNDEPFRLGCATHEERQQWMASLATARLCHFRFVLEHCVTHLNEYALQVPGLFRVGAREPDVTALKKLFDDGRTDIDLTKYDPHVIATTLKRYFRGLPEPLLTFELYPKFIGTQQIEDEDERAHAISVVLSLLPPINKLLLQYLLAFLARVCGHSEVNEMTPSNLATVFAPNLLTRRGETPEDALADTSARLHLIKMLIAEYDYFFGDEADTDQDVDLMSNNSSDAEPSPPKQATLQPQQPAEVDNIVTPRPDPLAKPPAQQAVVEEDSGELPPNPNNLPVGKATFDFEAKDPQHQLSFKKGDWVLIHKRNPTGWWLGECRGRKGLFPYNYVKMDEANKDGPSLAEKVLTSNTAYVGAPRKQSLVGAAGGTPVGGPVSMAPPSTTSASGDGGAIRQRFEEEAHARRHAEESRKALSAMLDDSKRSNTQMAQRLNATTQQLQDFANKISALEAEKEQVLVAQAALQKTVTQLQTEVASSNATRDSLLRERGKLEAATKAIVQASSATDQARVSMAVSQALSAGAPSNLSPAEELAFENGRRTELELECSSLSGAVSALLGLAAADLARKGNRAVSDDVWNRHNARVGRQLELAKAANQALQQLQQSLKEEVDDLTTAFST